MRLNVAKFLQETVAEMNVNNNSSSNAQEFVDFFTKWRSTGDQAPTKDILQIAKKFEDTLTLGSLSRPQLVSMCKYMNLNAFGTDAFLRHHITTSLANLKKDDEMILKEGVDSLSLSELQSACSARGIRIIGVSGARMRSELTQWIELNLVHGIPSSLLILSRAFIISERIPTDSQQSLDDSAQALQATLSSLPTQVVNEAALKISESSGVATFKQKLEVLKDQEELIVDELNQEQAHIELKIKLDQEMEENKYIDLTFPEVKNVILKNDITNINQVLQSVSTSSALADVKIELELLKQKINDSKMSNPSRITKTVDSMIAKLEKQLVKVDNEIGSKLHVEGTADGLVSVGKLDEILVDERQKMVVRSLDTDGDGMVDIGEVKKLAEGVELTEGSGVVVDKK